jgi:hypothetical protein
MAFGNSDRLYTASTRVTPTGQRRWENDWKDIYGLLLPEQNGSM